MQSLLQLRLCKDVYILTHALLDLLVELVLPMVKNPTEPLTNWGSKSGTYFWSGARSPYQTVSRGTISKSSCILQKSVVLIKWINKHIPDIQKHQHSLLKTLKEAKGHAARGRCSPLRRAISSNCERATKAVLFRIPLQLESALCFFTHDKL